MDKFLVTIMMFFYKLEGGYVNDKNDLGGETGAGGITLKLLEKYKKYWAKYAWVGDMSNIPTDLVLFVLKKEFVDGMKLDWYSPTKPYLLSILDISPALTTLLYGWGMNSGGKHPIIALQRYLNAMNNGGKYYPNIGVDGTMGTDTLSALNSYYERFKLKGVERNLIEAISGLQFAYYLDITESRKKELNELYFNGWCNRIEETEDFIKSKPFI